MNRLVRLASAGCAALALVACSAPAADAPAAPGAEATAEGFRALTSLSSYRYTLLLEASTDLMDLSDVPAGLDIDGEVMRIEVEGVRVNPDQEHSRADSSFGPLRFQRETILAGHELWSRESGGAWRERATLTRPEDLVGQEVQLSPAVIFGNEDPVLLHRITADLDQRPHSTDTLRGRPARVWRLDGDWLRGYEEDFREVIPAFSWPEEIEIYLWEDIEERVGTKLIVRAATPANPRALWLEMELFDLNDPAIEVNLPGGGARS